MIVATHPFRYTPGIVTVNNTDLEVLEHPDYAVAHPRDDGDKGGTCGRCVLAIRPDTGEIVLLWCCGGINWSVSREDPHHDRHRQELAA